jgi:hypothetical protein
LTNKHDAAHALPLVDADGLNSVEVTPNAAGIIFATIVARCPFARIHFSPAQAIIYLSNRRGLCRERQGARGDYGAAIKMRSAIKRGRVERLQRLP